MGADDGNVAENDDVFEGYSGQIGDEDDYLVAVPWASERCVS